MQRERFSRGPCSNSDRARLGLGLKILGRPFVYEADGSFRLAIYSVEANI